MEDGFQGLDFSRFDSERELLEHAELQQHHGACTVAFLVLAKELVHTV